MFGKGIIAAVLAGSMLCGMTEAVKADYLVMASSVNINYCEIADYKNIDFVDRHGNPFYLGVSAGRLEFTSNDATSISCHIKSCSKGNTIATKNTMSSTFALDAADNMKEDEVYRVELKCRISDVSFNCDDVFIRKDGDGNVRFVKSPLYDFNVERCSEMWTDAQSLQECLQPQNDIESDDPYVIAVSNDICEGLTDEWDKAFAIYSFIVKEFAYDDVQLEDKHYVYQDDAVSLLRRKVSICEGFSNVFVALCRAQGIPAVVQFGITESFADFTSISGKRDAEWPNHAWAAVFLGGEWRFVDPTFDLRNHFEGTDYRTATVTKGSPSYDYFCMPLEVFSTLHKVCDADTVHGIESSGSCGDDARYTISRDGTLTISGSGRIKLPDYVNGFSRIVFAEGSNITTIGEECFIDCDLITEVILPDTVTVIEDEAFDTCEDLEYVYLPEGLQSIGQEAFDVCDELTYVYVPDSVTNVDKYAFDDCSRLILSVPEHLRNITEYNYVQPYRVIVRDK